MAFLILLLSFQNPYSGETSIVLINFTVLKIKQNNKSLRGALTLQMEKTG
jgi:hypothetical protein